MAEAKQKPDNSKQKTEKTEKVLAKLDQSSDVRPLSSVKTTKAGKRSAKAQAEVAEKEAKETRKAKAKKADEAKEEAPKPKQKPRVKKYSKNQKAARALIEKGKGYTIAEAIELLPQISKTKFDASAELHVALNIDPRQADQMLRASTSLPAGTGKTVKIAVIAGDKEAEAAKKAGADMTDADAITKDIEKEKFNFDMLIATPEKMAELGKHAKVLGPKGLMPSPKNGTVTPDPASSVGEFKKGKVELKNDANGIVHVTFGKLSFKPQDLSENLKAVIRSLSSNKPSGVKGVFVRSMFVTASMSPSVKLDASQAAKDSKEK
jgi:large subunit ribosomal protein L1